jgi:hypothetical protein
MIPNAISALTKLGIKSAYTLATFHKGKNYYEAHQVVELDVSHTSSTESVIHAQVQGTTRYTVSIQISNTKHAIHLNGKCSCPLRQNCKHIVAVLLQTVDHQTLFVAETKNNVAVLDSQEQAKKTDDPRVHHWLNQLKHAMTEMSSEPPAVDTTYGLYYVLSKIAGQAHQLGVEPLIIRRLKAGGLGSSKSYSETALAQRKHFYPIDHELLAQLEVIKRSTRYLGYAPIYCLRGSQGESLLLKLIHTGRCHWHSAHNPPLTIADPKSVEVYWELDEQGMQTLRFGVPEQRYPIFFIEQPWYVDESAATCGLLNTSLDLSLAKLLLSAPKIPPAEVDTVVHFFNQHGPVSVIQPPKQLIQKRMQNRVC